MQFEAFGAPSALESARQLFAPRELIRPRRAKPIGALFGRAPRDRHWCLIRLSFAAPRQRNRWTPPPSPPPDDAAPPGDQWACRLHLPSPAAATSCAAARPPPATGAGRPAPQEARVDAPPPPRSGEALERSRAEEAKDQSKWSEAATLTPSCARSSRGRKSAARGLLRRAPGLFRTLHVRQRPRRLTKKARPLPDRVARPRPARGHQS